MTVSDYLVQFLRRKGIGHVFELSGGMITRFLDALHKDGAIQIVSVHHEQAAAFAADAFGRMTGIPGVAMATSGPGATNLLTGIGSCYFDSSPAIFITGQVNRHEQKRDRRIRQMGFQETDIVSMAGPITKAAWRVELPEQVPVILQQAFALATDGRPGPVLVDIPMDVQRAEITEIGQPEIESQQTARSSIVDCQRLRDLLLAAQRPLVLAGGGVRASRMTDEFRCFVDLTAVPVVNSLMAVDALPYAHPCRVGMIGSYGNRWANLALSRSDLLLVLGSRLDVRQTGSRTDAFKSGRTILHVDCDEAEINNRVTGCEAVIADLSAFLPQVTRLLRSDGSDFTGSWTEWKLEIEDLRAAWPDTAELKECPGINPNLFMHEVSQHSSAAAAFVIDVGQHQMWAAQSLELRAEQRFVTSGGMGSMGFALPAAIGTSLACPGQPIIVIAGDGGFQCNIQ
jgi:acetolactate synthase-1/2/3 large subunit